MCPGSVRGRRADKHGPALWLTVPTCLRTQMVPDLDPPAKRQHRHRTAGAASGREERRPLGKGFRRSLFQSCASDVLCAGHLTGPEPGSVTSADKPCPPSDSSTQPACPASPLTVPSADLADRPRDYFLPASSRSLPGTSALWIQDNPRRNFS